MSVLSRRTIIGRTAILVATAALTGAAGRPAGAATPAPIAASPADPLPDLVTAMRRAQRHWDRACDRLEVAENAAIEAGWMVRTVFMRVGRHGCSSTRMIVQACQPSDIAGPPMEHLPELLREYRRRVAYRRRQRRAAGLAPLDAKVAAGRKDYYRAAWLVATTPATSMAGLILKLKEIKSDADQGDRVISRTLVRVALADAKRLARGASV